MQGAWCVVQAVGCRMQNCGVQVAGCMTKYQPGDNMSTGLMRLIKHRILHTVNDRYQVTKNSFKRGYMVATLSNSQNGINFT